MLRIESSEESESRSGDMADYGSNEDVGSYDGDSGTDSGTSMHEIEEGKGKGIVISEGSSVAKKKGGRVAAGRQLQSVPIDGYPSKATVQRLNGINFPRGVEWRVPLSTERAWAPPDGFMCLYESYFERAHLFFPLPRAIIEFCARKRIAISQLGTVTMIDLLGMIVFGAELGIAVDASFLERRVGLIANTKSQGTFQTQAGVVRGKPGKISGWNWNYFYVRINEASVGGAGSSIISGWNRVLGMLILFAVLGTRYLVRFDQRLVLVSAGTKGHEDRRVKDRGEPYSSNLKRIEQKSDREFARFTQDRVDRQKLRICEQSGYVVSRLSVGRDEGSSRNNPAPEGAVHPVKGVREGGSDDREGVDSDCESLVNKRAKVDAARREKMKVGETEMVKDASVEAKKKKVAALAAAGLGAKKRKEKEERKKKDSDVEIIEVAQEGDGGGSRSNPPVFKKPRVEGSLVIGGSASTMSKREGKKVQTGEGRSHRFQFDYQGEKPIMMDPKTCGRFLQQIPEALDEYASGDVDLDATYDKFAGLMFELVNVENRYVRGHERVVMELKKESSALEGEVMKLKEDNVALKTLETDVEEERKRCASKEAELMTRVIEVGAKEAEIGRLSLELRLRTEEREAAKLEMKKKEEEIESLRQELLGVGDLPKKVAELKVALASRTEEMGMVERGCRETLKRLLREQRDALYAGYLEKNERSCDRLDRYLSEREKREEVESKLDQAVGCRAALKALKKKKIVAVPDGTLLELKEKKKEYRKELEKFAVNEFSSEDLRLGLPDDVGVINVDGIDFRSVLVAASGDVEIEGRVKAIQGMGP